MFISSPSSQEVSPLCYGNQSTVLFTLRLNDIPKLLLKTFSLSLKTESHPSPEGGSQSKEKSLWKLQSRGTHTQPRYFTMMNVSDIGLY